MLPTINDLKPVFMIQPTDATKDALLSGIVARAQAVIAALLDRPLGFEGRQFVIEDPRAAANDYVGLRGEFRSPQTLRVPATPFSVITIVDRDGNTVDETTYRANGTSGVVTRVSNNAWDRWPYTVSVTWGLGVRDDYITVVEPALSAAIIDLAADYYNRRNPQASMESSGGGVVTQYERQKHGIPERIYDAIAPFRRITL